MSTQDFTAIYNWRDFTVAASVFNLTDEDPPDVYLPQNWDPYTHDGFGRMYKLQLTYRLGTN
jgi:outer membrane receptor protein involved in Fe transport